MPDVNIARDDIPKVLCDLPPMSPNQVDRTSFFRIKRHLWARKRREPA